MNTLKTASAQELKELATEKTDKKLQNIVQPIHMLARNSQAFVPELPYIAVFLFKMDPRATKKRIKGFTCIQLGKAGGGGGMCKEVSERKKRRIEDMQARLVPKTPFLDFVV